jgi:N-acetylneuraminate synthase
MDSLEACFPDDRTFIIAEIGTSHLGDPRRAADLIDAAAEAGADAVKTQIVYAEEIIHAAAGHIELPGGSVPLFDRFRELEVKPEFFHDMAARCDDRGVAFLASCFGPRSLADLVGLGAGVVKIASPELNHAPLLRMVREEGRAAILSAGVATLADIARAVDLVGRGSCGVLHCITAYPAPEEEYNLRVLANLQATLGVPVGVSDHTLDSALVPAVAAAVGGRAVEKHLTLSRADSGLDDPIAQEPPAFADMVRAVRDVEAVRHSESAETTLAELRDRFGSERVEAVLGTGVKEPAPSEREHYGRSNRSILATLDIGAGEIINEENAACLRSEQNTEPGLSPFLWDEIRGARAARAIPGGTGIRFEHLLDR